MTEASRRAVLGIPFGLLGTSLLAAVEKNTPAPPKLDDWAKVRAQFQLAPGWLHFAGFYIASHPAPVRAAIDGFRRALDENPFMTVEHGMFESDEENMERRVCEAAAAYLGGRPDEIALTGSTTQGLALVYHGLPLGPGDEIVTTAHDHVVHHECIRLSTERNGATSRRITLFDEASTATADGILARIREGIGPKTRVLGVTWVHSATGIRLPIKQIAAELVEINRGREKPVLLVVDGVHGLGCSAESVAELGADFFCAGTHKWIFAPRGTGLVWARAPQWALLRPLIPSFSDMESYNAWKENRLPRGPTNAARITPGGFHAFEHSWGAAAAFRMHQQMGRERVATRVAELNGRIKDGLASIKKVKQHTPRDPALSAGICCFEIDGLKPEQAVDALLKKKIIASTSPYAVTYARLSAGLMNTPEDIDKAIAAVKAIAA